MSERYEPHPPADPYGGRQPGTARLPAPPPVGSPSAFSSAPSSPPPAPPAGRRRSRTTEYVLKGLGLVAVAVVSGFLWWLFQHQSPAPSSSAPQPSGQYRLTLYNGPSVSTDCATHSYGRVHTYLAAHPCTRLTRVLYTGTLPNGAKVITSVVSVQMPSSAEAAQLNALTKADGTGNVTDLVTDGVTVDGGPTSLANGAFRSEQRSTTVVIALTEYTDGKRDTGAINRDSALRAVSADALRLGTTGS